MQSLIVFYSRFGNTEAVAEAIAEPLRAAGSVRELSIEQLSASDFEGMDLIVMGVPTHKMNLPTNVISILEALPRDCLRGTPFAAFDTSYKMSWILNRFTASKKLNRRLRKLGGKPLVSPEIFLVTDKEGPLFEGELERAKAWAAAILEQYERFAGQVKREAHAA